MSDALPWIAIAVSILSAAFAGTAWWTSREKLRLDLYDRRFKIYLKTINFYHMLSVWRPTIEEQRLTTLQDSPKLERAQRSFIKASREAQFLFDDQSGIKDLLVQMHADSVGVIGYRRDVAYHAAEGPQKVQDYNAMEVRRRRFESAIPLLEEKLARYLDFHSLYAPRDPEY